MTRLKTLDIAKISAELDQYDKELLVKTGCNLRGIAFRSAGVEEKTAQDLIALHTLIFFNNHETR